MYRFLQGPETDQATVQKIRDAIRDQREITVQLINYTKSGELLFLGFLNASILDSLLLPQYWFVCWLVGTIMSYMISNIAGKKFWNLFHLQPMRDQKVAARCVFYYILINTSSKIWSYVCCAFLLAFKSCVILAGGTSILHWCTTRW